MIAGIGVDLCRIDRMERALLRYGDRFSQRLFTPGELADCAQRRDQAACLAKRFAAKEALVKAMGTGFRDGLWFRQIEVTHDPLGRPILRVSGATEARLQQMGPMIMHLSLSDEDGMALAMVVLERAPDPLARIPGHLVNMRP